MAFCLCIIKCIFCKLADVATWQTLKLFSLSYNLFQAFIIIIIIIISPIHCITIPEIKLHGYKISIFYQSALCVSCHLSFSATWCRPNLFKMPRQPLIPLCILYHNTFCGQIFHLSLHTIEIQFLIFGFS